MDVSETGSWRVISGELESINHNGPVLSRFPPALVTPILERYTAKSDLVLDPFAGYATTLVVSKAMGRSSVGFEPVEDIWRFGASLLGDPMSSSSTSSQFFNDRVENLGSYDFPSADLVLSSPPFDHFYELSLGDSSKFESHIGSLFAPVVERMKPGGAMVLELVNKRDSSGRLYPHGFHATAVLAEMVEFLGETIVCNRDRVEVTPGFTHSVLVHFRKQ